jgi:biopolymer transport protein ExbB
MNDGGPIMWVILICGVLALFIFLMKVFQFHRDEISVRELMRGLFNVLKRNGVVEALTLCDNTPGPVARLLSAGILARQRGDNKIDDAISSACMEEVARLERHINILGTIGYIAPLLGLLGTVLGLMEAFQSVHSTESVYLSVTELASAVNLALITTASGLAVAIFCYAAYNYLHARLDSITLDIEKAASEISAFFERQAPEVTAGTAADAGVEK